MNYSRSSVLITGASQGIGRAIALAFASSTDRKLILLARSEKKLEKTRELCEEAGASQVLVWVCDASDGDQVDNLALPKGFPDPGILINNAGSFLIKPLASTTREEFDEQVHANLFTAVNITRRFLPGLKKMNRALIINICSEGSLVGLADSGAYAAAKHALLGYTRSLRKELMSTNIAVSALNLGQTQSNSWKGSDIDRSRLIDARDVARLLVVLTEFSGRTVAEEIVLKPQHGRVPPM